MAPLYPLLAMATLALSAASVAALPWLSAGRWLRAGSAVAFIGALGSAAVSVLWIRRGLAPLESFFPMERFVSALRDSPVTPWWFALISMALAIGILAVSVETGSHAEKRRRLFLVLLAGIGGLSLAGSGHLLVGIAAWPLVSLSLTLASLQKNLPAARARALVTVFFADFFSFVLLCLGTAFLFSQYQTLSLDLLFEAIQAESQNSDILLYTGTALWLAALLVRLGAVPFHMAVCERVQSGNLSVSGFAAVFLALTATAFGWGLAGDILRPALPQWQDFLSCAGLVTAWCGALGMLVRPSWRSLVAYALVAQSGWMLLALASRGPLSLEPECFFLVAGQSLALLLAHFGAGILEKNTGRRADDLVRGLARRNGPLAFVLISALFALAGLPPSVGFSARAVVLARVASDGFPVVALLAALSTAVAAVPCLVWISKMIGPPTDEAGWVYLARRESVLLWVFAATLWLAGIWPVISWPN